MNKAAKIRELYATGMAVNAIAAEVGCRPEYVRVVARQRKGGSSIHDRRYRASDAGREQRARTFKMRVYPRFREALCAYANAYHKTRRATGDRLKAAEAGRKAYAEARYGS